MPHLNEQTAEHVSQRRAEQREALAFVDAELSGFAGRFKEVASQLENLTTHGVSTVKPALAKIDMERIFWLMGERIEIERALRESAKDLHRMNAP
jgi:hypothetical protein